MALSLKDILPGLIGALTKTDEDDKPDLNAVLAQLLPIVLPLLIAALEKQAGPTTPAPNLEPGDQTPDIDVPEPVEPPVGVPEPPPKRTVPARGVLEVRWFVHERTGSIFYPGYAVVQDQRVEDGGKGFWDRMTGRTRLNTRTRINVTPTFFDEQDRELTGREWDENGWSYNLRYGARLEPDPDNPQSVAVPGTTVGFGDGTPHTEITLDPKDASVNVGGAQYRAGKGRAAELNVFEEGILTLWAETPDGYKTEPRVFRVA